ncbi:lysozyme [Clostridium neonatale]|uniref:Lysozyme n=1 Tax=Clostridium neonatale TaxID=137838 RepID=A0A650M6C4_9CLOT|nr:lysozyme [Clostridium neonatale]SUQ40235.1 Autolysin [Clostridium neonatale]SUQ45268.1 Autolysin [Clostridium neonatale]VCT83119.1 Autolysin [Clostridium neonatale]
MSDVISSSNTENILSEAQSSENIKNGWVLENDKWYYYEGNKKLTTEWVKSNDRWYYLEKDGHMVKDWFQTTKNNDWYYALQNETINNGKTFYEGEICTGWLKLNGKWHFFEDINENTLGVMYSDGIFKIKDKYHKFDKEGVWLEEVFSYEINNNVTVNDMVSDDLCDFISYFEGCRLKAYYCSSGVLTIGIGCTRKEVTSLGTITKERAYVELKKDVSKFACSIDDLCNKSNVDLKSYERDALISFAFNCGISALEKSTLWYNITKGIRDKNIIYENFLRFVKSSSGEVLQGLVRRRRAEAELFLLCRYLNI